MNNDETLEEFLGRVDDLAQESAPTEYSYLDKLASKKEEYSRAVEALGPNDPLVKKMGEEGSKYERLVNSHYFNSPIDRNQVIPSLKRDIDPAINLENRMKSAGDSVSERYLDRDYSNKVINSGDRFPIEGIMQEKSYGF